MPLGCAYGSSPHTWGILLGSPVHSDAERFIPTHVGNTAHALQVHQLPAVHPHTRGEYLSRLGNHGLCRGSSPHTWGIPQDAQKTETQKRFIPTHVGNTDLSHSGWPWYAVHPHTRGEYSSVSSPLTSSRGSSPHTWGIQLQEGDAPDLERFIPTHVGNTL